ncbi:prolyl aminopeptidase [Thalassotalea sp. PLHSN55]|uniref:prolyl aminopeptidase n=1 Tax=Thalassotalea sp. PLHSN55 TaxID=3435888 RepID=UPI003F84462F
MSRTLFPKISTYDQQWLKVSEQHQLYLEQSGNPEGTPVLYLHGGPGAGSNEHCRRFFDPEKYRIIIFDQRGCGQSTPSPSIIENTTAHLIADIELVRKHLGISQWLITGGSWGATLALLYGIAHADKVLGFILRGTFLATNNEYAWLYNRGGAEKFFPKYYQEFVNCLPFELRSSPLAGYHKVLTSENEVAAIAASKAWFLWELRLSSIEQQHVDKSHVHDAHQAHCMALISSHYFINHSFISGNYIVDHLDKIQSIPAIIIHGRYDMVCPLTSVNSLVSLWENAQLHILPVAGHSAFEKQTIDAFCKATDNMADFLAEKNL